MLIGDVSVPRIYAAFGGITGVPVAALMWREVGPWRAFGLALVVASAAALLMLALGQGACALSSCTRLADRHLGLERERRRRARCGRRSRSAPGRTSSPAAAWAAGPCAGRSWPRARRSRSSPATIERRRSARSATGGRAPASSGTAGRRSARSISISRSSCWRSIVALELAHPGALAVALVPGRAPRRASRCSWTPRWRSPVHTSGSDRPSSACHSSGGRSSIATTMPTWLTGLLVTRPDRHVGERAPAEQPDVAGRRRWRRRRRGSGSHRSRPVTYAAMRQRPGSSSASPALAGVAATGVVVARKRRAHAGLRPRRAAREAAQPPRGDRAARRTALSARKPPAPGS